MAPRYMGGAFRADSGSIDFTRPRVPTSCSFSARLSARNLVDASFSLRTISPPTADRRQQGRGRTEDRHLRPGRCGGWSAGRAVQSASGGTRRPGSESIGRGHRRLVVRGLGEHSRRLRCADSRASSRARREPNAIGRAGGRGSVGRRLPMGGAETHAVALVLAKNRRAPPTSDGANVSGFAPGWRDL